MLPMLEVDGEIWFQQECHHAHSLGINEVLRAIIPSYLISHLGDSA
jgi:hypothetical protein